MTNSQPRKDSRPVPEIEARGGDRIDWDKTVTGEPLQELEFMQPNRSHTVGDSQKRTGE